MKLTKYFFIMLTAVSLFSCTQYIDKGVNQIKILEGGLTPGSKQNVFYYKSKWIGTRDKEKDIPQSYVINLPKEIESYSVGVINSSVFRYSHHQFIFIVQEYNDDRADTPNLKDVTEDDWSSLIIKNFDHEFLKNLDLEELNLKDGRVSKIFAKDSISIVLYNIKKENYQDFLSNVQSLKKM